MIGDVLCMRSHNLIPCHVYSTSETYSLTHSPQVEGWALMSESTYKSRRSDTRALLPTSAHPGDRYSWRFNTSSHPTGSGAPAPTSTPPGTRPQRRLHKHFHSTDSTRGAPARTATPPGAHPELRRHTSARPTGTHAPAPTAASPGPLVLLRVSTCPHPTGIVAGAPTSTPRNDRPKPGAYTPSLFGST